MNFSGRLRSLREEKEMTQHEIAVDMQVKPENYNKWENGKSPNYDTLIQIARYHHCTTDYLLGVSDIKNEKELEYTNEAIRDLAQYGTDFYGGPKEFVSTLIDLFSSAHTPALEGFMQQFPTVLCNLNNAVNEAKRFIEESAPMPNVDNITQFGFNMQAWESLAKIYISKCFDAIREPALSGALEYAEEKERAATESIISIINYRPERMAQEGTLKMPSDMATED